MTQQATQEEVPTGFTLPEWNVHEALIRAGKKPYIDFQFQASMFGGRQQRGGLIIDFLFYNPPDLAINVQGEFFHQGLGVEAIARDRIARAALAGRGVTLIFIDAEDANTDADGAVTNALRYLDSSFLGGLGG
jgi:hypothetical protein